MHNTIDFEEAHPVETPELAKRMMAWADPWMLELDDSEDLHLAVVVHVCADYEVTPLKT